MHRRHRRRRVLRWVGTVLSLLILAAAVACLRWQTVSVGAGWGWKIGLNSGAFVAAHERASPSRSDEWLSFGRVYGSRAELAERWGAFGLWPQDVTSSTGPWTVRWVFVPLWMLFVLTAIPTALIGWLDRRRPEPGRCANCGYNLTGNITGRCPECGASIQA